MKWLIAILLIGGVAGLFSAVTGIESARYSSFSGHTIAYHALGGRLLALVLGSGLLFTAWGCWKRRRFAWYTIASLLWVSLVWAALRAVYLTFTIDLPIAALVLGSVGEVLKIAFIAWLIFKLWPKYRAEFEEAILESSVERSRHRTLDEQARVE